MQEAGMPNILKWFVIISGVTLARRAFAARLVGVEITLTILLFALWAAAVSVETGG
jgi:hypothetical protein